MYIPPVYQEGILPRDDFLAHAQLTPRCHTPATWTKGLVENASVFDLGQVDNTVGFNLHVLEWNGFHQHRGDFWAERGR